LVQLDRKSSSGLALGICRTKVRQIPGRAAGFTMIELAVAIVVIALLLGSILVPLQTQVEQRQIGDTQKTMEEIREVLVGFAAANGYLPCPDTTGDGVADPVTPGACPNAEGFIPWVTLNVPQGDAWGNRFRYRVAAEFTNTPVAPCVASDGRLGLCDTGNINVNTRASTKAIQALASNVVAVIISHGKNGYGATATTGIARPPVPASNVDEATNADPPGTTFISRTPTGIGTACSDTAAGQPFCEFDDIVTWLSPYTVFNRMVAAGKLP
jgi:prepilin-type N-terminal cleavage/methylation domain-containing protein